MLASSSSIVCSPLASEFLLDNTISPANNISLAEFYEQRKRGKDLMWNAG